MSALGVLLLQLPMLVARKDGIQSNSARYGTQKANRLCTYLCEKQTHACGLASLCMHVVYVLGKNLVMIAQFFGNKSNI